MAMVDVRGVTKVYRKDAEELVVLNGLSLKVEEGDYVGAIVDYTRAIELHPKWPEPWARRARARAAQGDAKGAAVDAGKALDLGAAGEDLKALRAGSRP